MHAEIFKAQRRLKVMDGGACLLDCPVALGREPAGPKRCEGDGRTPEGAYAI